MPGWSAPKTQYCILIQCWPIINDLTMLTTRIFRRILRLKFYEFDEIIFTENYIKISTNPWHVFLIGFSNIKINPWSIGILSYKPWTPKFFFQFEVIISNIYREVNVLVSSFCFIWIPMLWFYGHNIYFNSFSAGIDFIRQNLMSTAVRFWRIKTVPVLKGLR